MTPSELNSEILQIYGIILLTCPKCWKAFSSHDWLSDYINEYECSVCKYEDEQHNFPDLFT